MNRNKPYPGIAKIQIENRSKWTLIDCFRHVMQLIETEPDYCAQCRNQGCTFKFKDGVNVGLLPVCKAFPEDTMFFFITNDK